MTVLHFVQLADNLRPQGQVWQLILAQLTIFQNISQCPTATPQKRKGRKEKKRQDKTRPDKKRKEKKRKEKKRKEKNLCRAFSGVVFEGGQCVGNLVKKILICGFSYITNTVNYPRSHCGYCPQEKAPMPDQHSLYLSPKPRTNPDF